MDLVVVNQSEVACLLPMDECLDAVEAAFVSLARGEASLPLRTMVRLPGPAGILASMPAALGRTAGLKVITYFPGNTGTGRDAHQGAVLLFDEEHGGLLAIADATEITALRTAAASGVATKYLAREDAGDLALLGTGTQARTHLAAMGLVRKIRRVRVFSRNPENARAFAARESERHGIPVEAAGSAREAVVGADLICTVTTSKEPVLLGEWLAPGAHVNAAGASVAAMRELDTAAVLRSRLFVDRRESALAEAGEFLIPKGEGAFGDEKIEGELGDVVTGKTPGRKTPGEITLFKSVGLAIEDVAAVRHVYRKARELGVGTVVPFGGSRDATA